ncbi:nitrite reductase [Lysinibacillus fusiformis]|nr:nitrite reductase [Lysinibacillus fusiformis]
MKRALHWLGLTAIYLTGIVISLASSINIFNGSSSLDTRKIDQNIERLRKLDWFNDLYESERHHKSFFINLEVRKYLESSIRISRLESSEREQKKFVRLLEKVANAREN